MFGWCWSQLEPTRSNLPVWLYAWQWILLSSVDTLNLIPFLCPLAVRIFFFSSPHPLGFFFLSWVLNVFIPFSSSHLHIQHMQNLAVCLLLLVPCLFAFFSRVSMMSVCLFICLSLVLCSSVCDFLPLCTPRTDTHHPVPAPEKQAHTQTGTHTQAPFSLGFLKSENCWESEWQHYMHSLKHDWRGF